LKQFRGWPNPYAGGQCRNVAAHGLAAQSGRRDVFMVGAALLRHSSIPEIRSRQITRLGLQPVDLTQSGHWADRLLFERSQILQIGTVIL
jgi:hypothetical protein